MTFDVLLVVGCWLLVVGWGLGFFVVCCLVWFVVFIVVCCLFFVSCLSLLFPLFFFWASQL